ncbi:HlyD family secretion protein [Clostridium sporogenes]|uniref:HlyD family secretion protein n=1 Tax=Clostridium sporogenes TaxID=1509 RepID=UPI002237BF43|nr:HlyD family secretion protein [Clostridium sporogenes]EKS4343564.1 HlyD family efflux transporter periplasmic adaptor subunit [Clostridium botulinum]EKS4394609.1 HlyD family efflux transporter periplasmic adaptor subunit [Clostridium botulinum]MCW6079163.1 HlyD family secretion protein [Clostridium sporogenes]
MKAIIQNIDEIKDSREILESKPHPFTTIFIYILLLIFLSAFTWCWFAEKEIVVDVQGVVRPNENIHKVSNLLGSKVSSVNFKNGDKVEKGKVLYTLEHKELDVQRSSLYKSKKDLEKEISNLEKLKKSISDNKNYFSDNKDEKEYYNKYLNYEKSKKNPDNDKKIVNSQINNLNSKINNLNLLKKSAQNNSNYLSSSTSYYSQFKDYSINIESYEKNIQALTDSYNSLKNKNAEEVLVNDAKAKLEEAKLELTKYKNQFTLNIENAIEECNDKIKDLNNQVSSNDDAKEINEEKIKSSALVEIDNSIKLSKEKLEEITTNLKVVDMNIDKCTIKAPIDGIVDISTPIKTGDLVGEGQEVLNILPSESKYKIDLMILNKDVANIKRGTNIKYDFQALPYKEYGYLNGKLENISVDSKLDPKSGVSFYTGEASIDSKALYSHKGEKAQIKSGMVCTAKIITRKEKMLYYLLEKINLKD